jgi:hypothetical protein
MDNEDGQVTFTSMETGMYLSVLGVITAVGIFGLYVLYVWATSNE